MVCIICLVPCVKINELLITYNVLITFDCLVIIKSPLSSQAITKEGNFPPITVINFATKHKGNKISNNLLHPRSQETCLCSPAIFLHILTMCNVEFETGTWSGHSANY